MYSKRKYKVVGFVGNTDKFAIELTLKELLFSKVDDWEYMYALQEETDLILDLQVNETMFVSLDRDNSLYKGVLIRVS